MNCSNCGEYNLPGSNVCIRCGNTLQSVNNNMNNINGTNNSINMNNNTTNMQTNNNNGNNNKKNTFKDNKKIIIIVCIAIVALLAIIFGIKGLLSKNSTDKSVFDEDFDITESYTFLIKSQDNNKYALFNSEGKQLTEYILTESETKFYNHAMLIENEEGAEAIINDSGKFVVEFGKYNEIFRYGAIFRAEKNDKTYLINSKGKVIKVFEDYVDIDTYFSTNEIILVNNLKKYYVIDYEGDIIYTFDEVADAKSPSISYEEGILTLFYNNENYIINIDSNKMLLKISDDTQLCVNSTDGTGKSFVLHSCTNWYTNTERDKYVIVNNGKVSYEFENDGECKSVTYDNKVLKCYTDDARYFIDTKGKKLYDFDITNAAYNTSKNFAITKDNKVEFYKNGKLVNIVEATLSSTGFREEGNYVLKIDGIYQLFNESGKQIGNNSFKSINSNYGKYHYGKIEDDKYTFIPSNGKTTETFYRINNAVGQYYSVKITEDTYGVADATTGKNIVPEISSEYKINKKGKNYIATSNVDGVTTIYNLETKKELIKTDNEVSLNTYYFKVLNNGVEEYYTYSTGKKFLGIKK